MLQGLKKRNELGLGKSALLVGFSYIAAFISLIPVLYTYIANDIQQIQFKYSSKLLYRAVYPYFPTQIPLVRVLLKDFVASLRKSQKI